MLRLLKKRPSPVEEDGAGERAGRLFDGGLNCTQSVLQATIGIDDPKIMQMADAFGGGIGDSGCLCGAVTGGVMALGFSGKGKKAARLMEDFKKAHRTTCCRGLSAPYKWLSREHLANCRRLTADTAERVAQLLE